MKALLLFVLVSSVFGISTAHAGLACQGVVGDIEKTPWVKLVTESGNGELSARAFTNNFSMDVVCVGQKSDCSDGVAFNIQYIDLKSSLTAPATSFMSIGAFDSHKHAQLSAHLVNSDGTQTTVMVDCSNK